MKNSLSAHMDYIIKMAFKRMYYIFRIAKEFRDIDALCLIFNSLVRSLLCYASPIWSPCYEVNAIKLESVQHRFFRMLSFKIGFGMRFDNYDYSLKASRTGIFSLKSFRDYQDILFLYNIIYEYVDSDTLFKLIKFNSQGRSLRRYRLFDTEFTRGNFLQKSFIHITCNRINALDDVKNIFEHKIIKFKNELRNIIFYYK